MLWCKQSSKISQNSPESIPLLAGPEGTIRHCQRREKNNVKRREEIDANAGIENAGIPTAGCMLPVNDPPEPLPAVR